MSKTILQFSDVTFGFQKRKPLFENLTCAFENNSKSGKIITLMGPSGVGKTTFCDLVLGIKKPQRGSIHLDPNNSNVAFIPQKAVLFEELGILENISCLKHSKTLRHSFKKEKVQQAINSLGLMDLVQKSTQTNKLSGGEAQRVMLARIQAVDCQVLILDEPCSFLDNRVKHSFLSALRETVDESGILAIMVTHIWDEAKMVADEVVFFNQTSDQPITLHRSSVINAHSCPPTIDSLFGIFWPTCLVIDLSANESNLYIPSEIIPNGSFLLGIYPDFQENKQCNDWIRTLLKQSIDIRSNKIAGYQNIIDEKFLAQNLSAAFYDHDGVLIDLSTKDTKLQNLSIDL